MTDMTKLALLRASSVCTLAFLGKVLKHQQNENDPFIAENADIINSKQFQDLVQAAIDDGIHSIRTVKELRYKITGAEVN